MWFVLGSLKRNQELKIRDELRRDNLECFVPLRYEVKTVKGHRERTMVPALSGLMFIKGTLEDLKEALKFRKHGLFLRKSTFTNKEEYLTISDHDMQNFIAVTEKAGEKITYYSPDEIQLRPGDKIRVSGGLYDGREGIIMRVKGKRRKQLVVSIPGILIASVELEPELVQLVPENSRSDSADQSNHKVPLGRRTLATNGTQECSNFKVQSPKSSKNLDEDKRQLFSLARRLIFDIPDAYQHEKEYYLLLTELKRTLSRLQDLKAYVSSQEAELALCLYLASFKLQQDVDTAEARLSKAISKLQDSSLLKLRCQMYLAKLSGDESLQQLLSDRITAIKSSSLSIKQRVLLEEYDLLFSSTP